jgi:hypothetical protein
MTGSNDVNGVLLAYTDDFWYVFEDEGEYKDHLIAIPDDERRSSQNQIKAKFREFTFHALG